jgi:hypothetical protein
MAGGMYVPLRPAIALRAALQSVEQTISEERHRNHIIPITDRLKASRQQLLAAADY